MFGFRSSVPSRAHRSLLEAENALAAQSQRHPDGWGIGWFVDDDAYIAKSSASAHACDRFQRASLALSSHTFVVHVRKATVGSVDPANAHPFRFGRWLFAHNGTLFSLDELRPFLEADLDDLARAQILGDTDSELLFHWLLARLHAEGIDRSGRSLPDATAVGRVVRTSLLALDAEAVRLDLERPIVNVLLTDGRMMIGHRAGMPLHLSTQKITCPEAPTCAAVKVCLEATRPAGHPVNHLLLSSEPIGTSENHWEDLPDGSTVVLDRQMNLDIVAPPEGWEAPILPERFRAVVKALEAS
jgi:glutamine amidotransferase